MKQMCDDLAQIKMGHKDVAPKQQSSLELSAIRAELKSMREDQSKALKQPQDEQRKLRDSTVDKQLQQLSDGLAQI